MIKSHSLNVALIQLKASNNKQENISKACSLVEKAAQKKSQFVLLPETFNFRGQTRVASIRREASEHIPGESTQPLMALARAKKIFILAGSVSEKSGRTDKVYNTSVLINPRGKIQARYRKIHLFEATVGQRVVSESKTCLAGTNTVLSKVKDFSVGMSICYDVRFPYLYEQYAKKSADILCIPSDFTQITGEAHWMTLLRARAIENTCYVLAPNQVGVNGAGIPSYGHSAIIDPWGRILAEASGKKEEIIVAKIDKNVITKTRTIMPSLKNRRNLK